MQKKPTSLKQKRRIRCSKIERKSQLTLLKDQRIVQKNEIKCQGKALIIAHIIKSTKYCAHI